jgi:hypothetical protein
MALVRISKQLIEDVKRVVNSLGHKEIGQINQPRLEVVPFNEHIRSISALFWGEHAHLRDLMPKQWCVKARGFTINTRHTHEDGYVEHTSQVSFLAPGLEVVLPPETVLGYTNGTHNVASMRVEYDVIAGAAADPGHLHHAVAAPVFAVVQYEQAVRKVRRAWDARRDQIVHFLSKCKSLNEAIKLWPEVKLYVPKHYIDTVETPVVRAQPVTRKEKVLADVDTDDITAAAIAAKLQGLI